jgi:multicomponent Na+:H+ antiporter subunit C
VTGHIPDLALVIVVGALVGCGVYLVLERSLTRIAIGLILVGNGVNLMFIMVGGPPGGAPIVGLTPEAEMSDPLPQAMVLTGIVITLALNAFLVSIAYRSWQLNEHDEVQDDLEDRRIARLAAIQQAGSDGPESSWVTLAEEAAEARDETFVEEHWLAEDLNEEMS